MQEDKVKMDVVVDVCFRDDELEHASVGYGSEMDRSGLRRLPVVSVLAACLASVKTVVHGMTSGQPHDSGWVRRYLSYLKSKWPSHT